MNYVIIGGDAAGMSAAMQIFKYDKSAKITILEKSEDYSYAQCGLPYGISGEISDMNQLVVRNRETYQTKFHMDARQNQEVIGIDVEAQCVAFKHNETETIDKIYYDKLLIATGARAYRPDWYDASLKGVYTLKTLADAKKIKSSMTNADRRAIVVGGGYVALEMAENLRHMGLQVTMLMRYQGLGSMFDEDMQADIIAKAEENKIQLCFEEEVVQLEGKSRLSHVITNNKRYAADILIVATGVRPETNFLKGTSLQLSSNGAVNVDAYMKTNVEGIYAAGDCAMQYHRLKHGLDYKPLGTNANKQGRIAGMNMVGRHRVYQGTLGTSVLRFFDLTLASTGLNQSEALALGLNVGSESLTSTDIASYFPNNKSLTIKLVYDQSDLSLLGAQIIGESGVDKRIDVIAMALFSKLHIQDLEDIDLAYSPPYNSVWDPIQKLARKIMQKHS